MYDGYFFELNRCSFDVKNYFFDFLDVIVMSEPYEVTIGIVLKKKKI